MGIDPISSSLGIIGIGMQIYGNMEAAQTAKQIASISSANAGLEGNINSVKQTQMNFEARRQQLEIFRNTQRARAQGMQSAVNQGAQYGSGLAGGLADTTNQGMFKSAGVANNQILGNQVFGYNAQISSNNQQIATLKGQQAEDQGWSSLGQNILSSSGTVGNIFKSSSSPSTS